MRILLDYRPALRERTGVGQYVHELASAIAGLLSPGDSLTLFSSSWKDRLAPDVVPGATAIDRRIPVRLLNLAWHRLGWPAVERLTGDVDVAQSAHPLLMPTRRGLRAVVVYDLDFLDHPERTRAEVRRDYPVLAGVHARRADLVVTISEHTASQIESRLGVSRQQIVLCRPGAPGSASGRGRAGAEDLSVSAHSPADEPSRAGPILFVGTIEPRKNLPALFGAYERIVSRRPDAPPLVIAGKHVEQSAAILRTLQTKPALAGRVQIPGYVSDAERERLYRTASMLVLPSLEEGFGMTALEAMTAGVPVVASRAGALPEVVGNAGVLVDQTSEDDIAHGIERLLTDPGLRARYAGAGRIRAREFSWTASAERLLAAYRDALARRAAAR